MNCKPGDLAVVVRSDYEDSIGRFCLVLKHHDFDEDGLNWLCRFPSRITWQNQDTWRDERGRNGMVPDAWLRPIRPGDITDEEVRDLYAPKQKETV